MRTSAIVASILALAFWTIGCGDDDSGTVDSNTHSDGPHFDGSPSFDAAPPTPQPFDITFADTCPAFSGCGGDLVGTWFYTGICVTYDELLGLTASACSTLTITSVSGTAQGSVVFTATDVTRTMTGTATVVANVPTECTLGFACDVLGGRLSGQGRTVTCVDHTGGGCDCTVTQDVGVTNSGTYSTAGNTLTTGTPAHTYDYCVNGTTLQYKDRTPPSPTDNPELGISTLQKQ